MENLTGTESLLVIRFAQILVALGNVYLVYRLGLLLFDRRVALLAASGLCLYPSLLAFNVFILTEVLFTFLLTSTVLGVAILLRKENTWAALGSGIALGLGALTRSVLWPFPAILCLIHIPRMPGTGTAPALIALCFSWDMRSWSRPWAIRNTQLQGVFTVVDTMGGITLRMGNYAYTPLNRAWDPVTLHGDKSIFQDLRAEHPNVFSWTEGQKEKWALRNALVYMLEHPGVTIQRSIVKFANFWGLERTVIAGWQQELYKPPRWLAVIGTILIPLFYTAVMLLACLGIFLAPPEDRRAHGLLLLPLVFIAGMHALTFGHERYHLPLIPILLLYASAAISRRSWHNFGYRLRPVVAPLAAASCLLVIWGREVLIVDADRIQIFLRMIF